MSRRVSRRASVYLMALGSAMLVTIIGVGAVLAVQVRQDGVQAANDFVAARFLAQSAVDQGLLILATESDWRTSYTNGAWLSKIALGDGRLTLLGQDPDDDDLADDGADSLILTGMGACGKSQYNLSVTLVPPIEPLEALSTCLHAGGDIDVDWAGSFTGTGAPLSANGYLWNLGTINADVEVQGGTTNTPINGTVTTPAPDKDLPDDDVFDKYVALATQISPPATMEFSVLAPGRNPWGALNADGVYYIDTGGGDLMIQATRIHGTLVVRTRGGIVYVAQQVLLHPARPDYPALIVRGHLQVGFESSNDLVESWWGTNYNPVGAPYEGQTDSDLSDRYFNGIQGLVHVTGSFRCVANSHIRGAVICEGDVYIDSALKVTHDPDLASSPPLHYTSYGPMAIVPGSWRQTIGLPVMAVAEAAAMAVEK